MRPAAGSVKKKKRSRSHLDLVSLGGAHDEVVGDAARLELAGHAQRQGVAAGLARALAHHERALRLLAQHLQRDFPARARTLRESKKLSRADDCGTLYNTVFARPLLCAAERRGRALPRGISSLLRIIIKRVFFYGRARVGIATP